MFKLVEFLLDVYDYYINLINRKREKKKVKLLS